jgi:hypothetical protein
MHPEIIMISGNLSPALVSPLHICNSLEILVALLFIYCILDLWSYIATQDLLSLSLNLFLESKSNHISQ